MAGMINLPEPSLKGEISIEETLASRRSIRSYSDRALTMDEISQILWSAQGITADWGARTAPSAGGLFPMRIYLVAGKAENLNPGVYLYDPHNNALKPVRDGDYRGQLMSASLNQGCVGSAPISIIITAIPSITEARYGNRSMRYIDNEAGSISQNVYLQCEALGLGTVVIGAFNDDQVAEICSPDVSPRLIMPIGAR
ncbi:MAG TPA: SagB/ThcOx family dehydrogenase [Firmicutes bacterium]|nr:SagB/ThcOx family dehydrogenase [Bacillota bacterium]